MHPVLQLMWSTTPIVRVPKYFRCKVHRIPSALTSWLIELSKSQTGVRESAFENDNFLKLF